MIKLRQFIPTPLPQPSDYWGNFHDRLVFFGACNCYNEYRRSKTTKNFLEALRGFDLEKYPDMLRRRKRLWN